MVDGQTDGRAEGGCGHGHLDHAVQVATLADEHVVLTDAQLDAWAALRVAQALGLG